MKLPLIFIRTFFVLLSILFMTTYTLSCPNRDGTCSVPSQFPIQKTLKGVLFGLILSAILIGFDKLFRKSNLRSFNIVVIGLFFGYLMGQALILVFDAFLIIGAKSMMGQMSPQMIEIIKVCFFLFGLYLGTLITLRSSDEFYISIPFVKFSAITKAKKDLLIHPTALVDTRLISIAETGLLDHTLVIPRFVVRYFYNELEGGDEGGKRRARTALENLGKLEKIESLSLTFVETDFQEVKEVSDKLNRLARLSTANILSSDMSKIEAIEIEGVRNINLNDLSLILKPAHQSGEVFKVTITRIGKIPTQGVGYTQQGHMVVVNEGAKHMNEEVEVCVVHQNMTKSGRIIFADLTEYME